MQGSVVIQKAIMEQMEIQEGQQHLVLIYPQMAVEEELEQCMEMDLLNEADDLLGRALEIQKSPRVYRLIGVLAVRKGEYARAEVALLSAMAEFPDDVDLIYDLSGVYVTTGRAGKAAELEKQSAEKADRLNELSGKLDALNDGYLLLAAMYKTEENKKKDIEDKLTLDLNTADSLRNSEEHIKNQDDSEMKLVETLTKDNEKLGSDIASLEQTISSLSEESRKTELSILCVPVK